jgi:hypothetical protein
MRVIVARIIGICAGSAPGALGQATAGLLAGDRAIVRVDGSNRADLPCRACEIAGQRRAPVVHGWSGDRDERFTASLDTLVGGLQAVRRGGGAPAAQYRPRVSLAVSEFGQLGARRHDPHTARTEIHVNGGVNLDADDPAEAVRIVGNLIPHGELLSRRSGGWAGEGTSGQEAPGRGAGWLHHYQYAPAGSMRLPGRSPLVPPGWPGYGRTARRAGARRYRPPAVSAHRISLDGGDDEGRPGRKG